MNQLKYRITGANFLNIKMLKLKAMIFVCFWCCLCLRACVFNH